MERLVLSVWLTVVAGTFAGGADRIQAAAPNGFPTLPVPAGNMLTEARADLRSRLFFDKPLAGTGNACATCDRP